MKIEYPNKIYESENSTIYKGKYQGFEEDVIVKVLNREHPTEEQIIRFNNEFEFTKNLEISGIRKVLKKDKKDGKNILICEYFEGEILKYFLNEFKDIGKIIKIACNLSQTLGEIHNHNIIHKDINSSNILINDENKIKIIDFGIATKYTLKAQNLSNPKNLEGTLAYISPEQTGRMNRSIDYRTDLYSLGVVLYEMFTKKMPFSERDNMELIHSHIAKKPVAPNDINNPYLGGKGVPKIISDIILKLLSKNAEDRYQSAFGLKHDLRKLIKFSKSFKQLEECSFPLGEKDFSGRLNIPEKLYGREKETEKLYKIYENVSKGKKELLLISGVSGVGKSALIYEIHKPLTIKNGFYIEGKFDQFQKNIPYFAIIKAFTDFVNLILKEDEEKMNFRKNLIQKSVGNVGKVLTDLIPELELIIGKQPELPKLEGEQAQNRFNYVFSNFVKSISTKENPLIIFIDDLHHVDNASIKLLKYLLSDPEIKYLFFIIAYRDNEMNTSTLNEFENLTEINISRTKLENLTENDINNLLNDSLKTNNANDFKNLSDLIYSKTSGNPFFAVQFLENLYKEEFLKFDFTKNVWKWNFAEIEKQNITDNVVELMASKIQKLPEQTQKTLKIAACIGNSFDLKILSVIYKNNIEICKKDLEPAIFQNLIFPLDKNNFKFIHDKIQLAVYSNISENDKNNFHLQIGKLLLKSFYEKKLEQQIFDVVNQINLGKDLIKNKDDKKQLAELNFQAGIKAKLSSAYLPAYNYLKISSNLLEKNSWQTDYEFTLNIYDELAELSYLTGSYEKTENYVNIIIKNAGDVLHKINAYSSLINAHRAQSKFTKAVQSGLKILSELGLYFPEKANVLYLLFNLFKALVSVKLFGVKISKLPLMSNEKKIVQLKLVDAIGSSAFISNKDLLPLLIVKGFNLIIKSGNSLNSPYFIAAFGLILGTLNKINQAEKFGKTATEIQKKYNFKQIESRTNYINSVFTNVWKIPLIKIEKILFKNYKTGLEIGDFEFASYSLLYSSYYNFYCDKNIKTLQKNLLENLKQIKKLNQKISLIRTKHLLQITNNLLNDNFNSVHLAIGKYFDENKEIPVLIKEGNIDTLGLVYQIKIFLIYIFNNIDEMQKVIEKLSEYEESYKGYYFYALVNFYHSLCLLTEIDSKNKKQKKSIVKQVYKNQKQMKIWAKYCPENYQNKYYLVEAEKFRALNKTELAESFYNKAIKSANKNRFINEEAISWEIAARFYLKNKNNILSKIYLQQAYKTYKIWGAVSKLKQLEEKYPQFLFEKQDIISKSNTTIISGGSTIVTGALSFDLTSMMKASQSLSGEVKLENLLKNMLKILMENAGADYVVIIKKDDGKFKIQAKGRYGSEKMEILKAEELKNTKSLALNIVNYVMRTGKFIVLDNALEDENYSRNIYIKNNNVKSVLCYPIIHKNKLVAILYLENNSTTHVFTQDRIKTINILSSQIAVSVDNALLYGNLEDKVNKRTQELQKAKDKIEENHKHITDGINYASRIQTAMLPTELLFRTYFSDYLIFLKPRDIVSGDFYWGKKVKHYIAVAVADCTGHGVPGAFVSMLGMTLLNEIVRNEEIQTAAHMLDELRTQVKVSFRQTGERNESQDGMDIALCVINTQTNELQFAGAYNPLYIIRNNKLIRIKADRQPIGIYKEEKPFTNQKFNLKKDDVIYMFSDGYKDQFGGDGGRKFMSKRFKNLLLAIHKKSTDEQKNLLENEFNNWRGNIEQIDDIAIIGLKI